MQQRIIASGGALPWNTKDYMDDVDSVPVDSGFWAPPTQVGGGMVNAWKVLNYTTTLSYDKFVLNDTHHFSRYHQVDITNNAAVPVTYNFTLQPAGGFEALGSSDWGLAYSIALVPVSIVPKVSFPTGSFKVAPGATKTAKWVPFCHRRHWTFVNIPRPR